MTNVYILEAEGLEWDPYGGQYGGGEYNDSTITICVFSTAFEAVAKGCLMELDPLLAITGDAGESSETYEYMHFTISEVEIDKTRGAW